MSGRYEFSEMFWFGTISGGPRSVQTRPGYVLCYPYRKVELALHNNLSKHLQDSNDAALFFQSIRKISILLLVGGSISKYENREGIYKLRYTKAKHELYFEINVPETRWANSNATEFQHYYADLMRQGLQLCLQRAKKNKGEVLDEQGFIDRYEMAIAEFLKMDFSHITELDGDDTETHKMIGSSFYLEMLEKMDSQCQTE